MTAVTPEEWFNSIPKITRSLMVAVLATTVLASLGFVGLGDLAFSWELVWRKFQLWRLITPFFVFGKFGFRFLMNMMLLYKFGSQLESNPYPSGGGTATGTPADYMYMFIFGGVVSLVLGHVLGLGFLGPSILFMVLYVWSKRFPTVPVGMMGIPGVNFFGVYLPWLYLGFSILMGESPILYLVGIASGHLYYFLQEVLPATPNYGYRLIKTPQFLADYINGPPTGPAPAVRNAAPRAFGGAGRVLGRD